MSTVYIQYPQSGGGGSSATTNSISFSIGTFDSQTGSAQGASISSASLFMQAATAILPGLVSSNSQTFAGLKTFSTGIIGSGFQVGAVIFSSSTGQLSQDNTNFSWDNANHQLSLTTSSADAVLTIGNREAFAGAPTATKIHVIGSSGAVARITVDAHNETAGAGGILLRRSRGTSSAPTQVLTDDTLGFFGASGYGQNSFGSVTAGALSFKASQNWNDTNQGSYFHITLNANSTSAGLVRLRVNQNGIIQASGYLGAAGVLTIGSGSSIVSGSVSLIAQVSGILPAANLPAGTQIGSVSLTNQVSGILPVANSSRLDQLVGSVSLTTQVSGILPSANLPVGTQIGSVSLTGQVSGILPVLNGGTGKSTTSIVIGSVTFAQTAPGNTYTLNYPAAQGGATTGLQNDGSGNLTWATVLTTPTNALTVTTATIGSVSVTSSAGGVAYTVKFPGAQGSTSSVLQNDGAGNLSWAPIGFTFSNTGAVKTASATDNWHSMASNSLNLTTGVWICGGSVKFGNSGSSPTYTDGTVNWFSANGGDNNTIPTILNSCSGLTVLSSFFNSIFNGAQAGGSGAGMPSGLTFGTGNDALIAQTVVVKVVGTATMYLVSYSTETTAANTRIGTYTWATRIG